MSENVPYNRDNYLHRGELFVVEDDLADGWVEDWAGAGVAEIEDLLAKHGQFLTYLAEREEANSDESTLATTADKKFSDQLTN